MDFIPPKLPSPVEEYLAQFDDLMPSPAAQGKLRVYVAGLLSETRRKNIQAIAAKAVGTEYQAAHHFLADSPWDEDALNRRRLTLLQKDPATRIQSAGWLIQDDTGQVRKPGGTDAVARQYIGNVGKVADGLVTVTTHYVDATQHYPITADLYWPKATVEALPEAERTPDRQRDKIDIALDQIRWALKEVAPRRPAGVTVDSWYGSSPKYLRALHEDIQIHYVAEIRGNRTVFVQFPGERGRPEHRAEELITLFRAHDYRRVWVRRADGTSQAMWAAGMTLRVAKLPYRQRLLVVVDDRERPDPATARLLLSNHLRMTDAEIVQTYALRNWVEVFYAEAKDDLGFDHAEVRREARLRRHWMLVFLAHAMVQSFRLRGSLSAWTRRKLATFDQALRCVQDLFRAEFWMTWIRQPEHVASFVSWFRATRGLTLAAAAPA